MSKKGWQSSRQDFISEGVKYYEVLNDFPYLTTKFEVVDSNRMTFYFSDHIKDIKKYHETKKQTSTVSTEM